MKQKIYSFSNLENNKIKPQVLLLVSHRRVSKFSITLVSMACLGRSCPSVTLLGWTSNLNCLSDDTAQVSGFDKEDADVLELDAVSQVDVVPHQA